MALTGRQLEILNYLKEHKYAKIGELSKKLFVSDATIRRELTEMKKLGLLERNHGGAVILEPNNEIALLVRYERDSEDKKQTADIAIKRLPDFKSVFIDNSSTALILARRLDLRFKTVVTNGVVIAMELSKREDVTVIMPGGTLLYNTNAVSGSTTLRNLADMHFGLTICSCAAINCDGAFETSLEQSELKRTALEHSTNKVLLADKNKFSKEATYRTTELNKYNVIFTNADNNLLEPFRSLKGVNIINK